MLITDTTVDIKEGGLYQRASWILLLNLTVTYFLLPTHAHLLGQAASVKSMGL